MRLYIDPGTGSMLFTVLIGLVTTVLFLSKRLWMRLQFYLNGGAVREKENKAHETFVIFSDHKRYWNVFQPVCDEFERRGIGLVYLTCSSDDPALEKPYRHIRASFIGEGNRAFAKLNMLDADIVLSTTPNLEVFQWKRSKNVKWYVHILHAANDPNMYHMFGLDDYDAVLLSGTYQEAQIRELEHKRSQPEKELVYAGLTYLDAMAERFAKHREAAGEARETKTILVAPSWGVNSLLHRFEDKFLQALKDTGYHIVIRPHPQMVISEKEFIGELQRKFPADDGFEWNSDNDNFEVLARSDLLISDFSGIIFDFILVFDRPLIYTETEYDNSKLDCWWSDETPWTFQTLPKVGHALSEQDIPRIREVIDDCLESASLREARKAAREETWMCRGEAAKRCVDYLVEKQKSFADEVDK